MKDLTQSLTSIAADSRRNFQDLFSPPFQMLVISPGMMFFDFSSSKSKLDDEEIQKHLPRKQSRQQSSCYILLSLFCKLKLTAAPA